MGSATETEMNNTLQEVSTNQLTKKQVHSPWSAQKVRKRSKPNVSFHPDIIVPVDELDESYGSPPKLQKRQDATPYPSQGNDHRPSTEDSYDFHTTEHSNQAPLLPLNHRSDAPHHHPHTDHNTTNNNNNNSSPSTSSPPTTTFATHHNAINKPATTPSAAAAAATAKSTPPTTSSLSMFERLVHACRSGGHSHGNGPSRSTTTPHKNNNTSGTFSIKGCFKSPFSGGRTHTHTTPPFQDVLDHHQSTRVPMDGDDEIVTLHHHHHHHHHQQQQQQQKTPQAPPPSPIDEDMFGLSHTSEDDKKTFGIRSIIRPGGGSRGEGEGGIVLPTVLYEEEEDEEEEAMREEPHHHHQEQQPTTSMNNAKLVTPLDVDALNEMLSSMCRLRDQAPDPREAQALVEAAEHAGVEIDGVTILRLKQLEQIHEQCSPLR